MRQRMDSGTVENSRISKRRAPKTQKQRKGENLTEGKVDKTLETILTKRILKLHRTKGLKKTPRRVFQKIQSEKLQMQKQSIWRFCRKQKEQQPGNPPNAVPADGLESDVKSLYLNISKASGCAINDNNEVMKWVAFAENFPAIPEKCFDVLKILKEELSEKSVLLISLLLHIALAKENNLLDFFIFLLGPDQVFRGGQGKAATSVELNDYFQHKEDFGGLFEKLSLKKPAFEPPIAEPVGAGEADTKANKTEQSTKSVSKSEVDARKDKSKVEGKATGDKDATKAKGKSAEVEDKELSVSLLNIQVGLIREAWKHPSADSLLVEEMDVGEAKLRQVVSGLAKFYSPDELTDRRVVLITNVKPGKLRDVMSEGLVLCASNEDHTIVEPLLPPEGSSNGERVYFSGIDGKPEDVLNPKRSS
ncbi:hypothetical protein L6164_029825 [Bauhinia variegata]|uniref:Uncharacterized protein n=1 Tax=Bauhinia variegata TaxID=167791 RepID=A0ACB9LAA5_BAUVA|nr:hypothetical protein L6164_029825 [Bauhinia variegata]